MDAVRVFDRIAPPNVYAQGARKIFWISPKILALLFQGFGWKHRIIINVFAFQFYWYGSILVKLPARAS